MNEKVKLCLNPASPHIRSTCSIKARTPTSSTSHLPPNMHLESTINHEKRGRNNI